MQKLMLIVVSILLISSISFADDIGGKFGIGVKGGVAQYYGDLSESSFGLNYSLSLDYWLGERVGLGFNYGKNQLKAEENSQYFKSDLWNYSLHLKLNLLPKSNLNPYLIVGYEWFDSDPMDKDGGWVSEFGRGIESGDYEKINNAIPVGLGFSYYLSEALSFDAEGLLHYTTIDYIDGYVEGDKDDAWISLAAGLSLHFGKAKDTDGDGIADRLDKDPLHAEDFDNFQDEDGAPDLDNDLDGVPDAIDKAPLDPEDMDGFQDDDGVPDPDNDNDGILDVDDRCPNEAETFNEYEDLDGCPDEKPEVAVEKGEAIILDGVNFATGSANLTENSKTILDKVVRTMTKNPDLELEIRGYTDNTGSYNGNMKISQRRAESVKNYLVGMGIESSRLATQGFGPENPIAPNDTREGRAQNRRIEFFRVK